MPTGSYRSTYVTMLVRTMFHITAGCNQSNIKDPEQPLTCSLRCPCQRPLDQKRRPEEWKGKPQNFSANVGLNPHVTEASEAYLQELISIGQTVGGH
jgi:hypothetical protein